MSLDNSKFFQETTCFIDNKEKTGQVVSIGTYGDGRQIVCFREEGEKLGKWVPVAALSGAVSDRVSQGEAVSSTPPVADKKKTKTDSSPKEKVEVMLSSEEEKIEAEVEKDINELEKFVSNIITAVQDKATQDIQSTSKFLTEAQKTVQQGLQASGKVIGDASEQLTKMLDSTTQATGEFVKKFWQKLVNSWNDAWKTRLLESILILDLPEKALDVVTKFKKKYPIFSNSQIAQESITEKVFYSLITGMAAAIPGATILVDLSSTTPLLIQMVYEIACAYEQDIKSPEAIHEIVAILGLTLTVDNLPKIGLGFLLKQNPIASFAINPIINATLFLGVGYAACQYYEAKLSGKDPLSAATYQELLSQVNSYFGELMTEVEKVQEIVSKAISLKGKLPA